MVIDHSQAQAGHLRPSMLRHRTCPAAQTIAGFFFLVRNIDMLQYVALIFNVDNKVMNFEKPTTSTEQESTLLKRLATMKHLRMLVGGLTVGAAFLLSEREVDKRNNIVDKINNEQNLTPERKAELLTETEYLSEQFSDNIQFYLGEADKRADQERDESHKPVEMIGFEEEGLNTDILREVWSEKYYPKGTILGQVEEVNYTRSTLVLSHYGMGNEATASTMEGEDVIKIHRLEDDGYTNPETYFMEAGDWSFSHELGHINDWTNNNTLSTDQRVEFLYEVTKHFNEPNSFQGVLNYARRIHNDNKQKENYYRVREFWAELTETYFTFPEILKKEDSEGYKLVEKWMTAKQPDFDPIAALEQRQELMKNVIKSKK